MLTETIAAISTGGSNSGINIIRVSGTNARKIVDKVFTNSKKLDHQKIFTHSQLKATLALGCFVPL